MIAMAELDPLNTVEEVAAFAKVSQSTVRRAAYAGTLRSLHAGPQLRFRREDVWAWLERRTDTVKEREQ